MKPINKTDQVIRKTVNKNLLIFSLMLFFTLAGLSAKSQIEQEFYSMFSYMVKTNSPVIAGNDLVLTANGGQIFQWTGPNNFSSSNSGVVISNASIVNEGTYFVQIIDTIRDTTFSMSTTVEVITLTNNYLTTQYNFLSCCQDSPFNLWVSNLPNPVPPGYTFTWTCNPPISYAIPQAQSTTIVFPAPTSGNTQVYAITLVIMDGNTNIATESIDITVHNCCDYIPNTGILLLDNQTLNQISGIPLTSTIAINGLFLLDNSWQASGFNKIIMLPESSVEVSNDWIMSDVTMTGCHYMWDAIRNFNPENNNSVTIIFDNVDISDSYKGIQILNSEYALIALNDCDFVNNYWSNTFYYNNNLDLRYIKNTFSGLGNLLPNNFNTWPDPTHVYAQVGILGGWNTNPGILADPTPLNTNSFFNLGYGIMAGHWDWKIEENATRFYNIPGQTETIYQGVGIGLVCTPPGNPTQAPPSLLTKIGNYTQNYDFNNCKYGIWVYGANSVIEGNKMINTDVGIRHFLCNDRDIRITNNTLDCNIFGIDFFHCNPVNSLEVSNNTITINGNSTFNNIGIRIDENLTNPGPVKYIIKSNTIDVIRGRYGIYNLSGRETVIAENVITLYDPQSNLAGIYAVSTVHNNIRCNRVYGQGPDFGNTILRTPYGIHIDASDKTRLTFNETDNTFTGLVFSSTNNGTTEIRRNRMFNHHTGLFYPDATSLTSDQYFMANSWEGSFSNKKAENQSWIAGSFFLVGLGAQYDPLPDVLCPNFPNWFSDYNILTPIEKWPCSFPFIPYVDSDEAITSYDSSIALNTVNFPVFADELSWSGNRFLFNKLEEDSTLMTSNALMQTYHDSIGQVSAGQYQVLTLQAQQAIVLSPVTQNLINTLQQQVNQLRDSLFYIDSILNNFLSISDSLYYNVLYYNILGSYKTSGMQLASAIQGANAIIQSKIDMVLVNNALLPDTALYEANEKTVNDIYYRTIGSRNTHFSQQDRSNLWRIASQCPISGGKGVYMARSMYALFSDTLFEDKSLCLSQGIVKNNHSTSALSKPETDRHYSCFPNPAQNQLSIEWDKPSDEKVMVQLVNNLGIIVSSFPVQLTGVNHAIDIQTVPSGILNLRIIHTNGVVINQKVIILK